MSVLRPKLLTVPGHPRMRFHNPLSYMAKLLNPFIWILNFLKYQAHLDTQHHYRNYQYEPYDFSKDIRYF